MENMDLLRNISFLKDLSTGELIKINILTENVSFSEGEEIMQEGAPCDAIYIVKSGSVRIMKGGAHLETVEAGEPLGEIAFIDKGPRSATIVAATDTALIRLASDKFEQVLAHDKELANKIYRSIIVTLCKRLRDATQALKIVPDYVMDSYKNFENI
ncbi:MAG: cyclic nucleotide-binding domain-containing protein [Nitrospirota bacterium]|nr:cyclic nucleotide-binding domain-containing protein [Nitrospirota bacterium]